ncbi:hypothetical protein Pmani_036008 [Petrolisthes manimaculis]|uniref:Intraflagellar transport protein 46 homolog n=1 Tax=Petrolisthes manimaculis TaxID=1843537 RepID=A0AAE1NL27_9EUCA|nr:hypothetical protein Pmani_036008 [Petrolisthes manimaculis]
MSSSRGLKAESIESFDYDEVTEISGGSHSLQHSYRSEADQNIQEVFSQSPQFHSSSKSKSEERITTESIVKDLVPLGSGSALQGVTMATVEENEFNTELEEKGEEAAHSGFHEGQSEPPTTSGGGRGKGEGIEEEEGDHLDGTLSNENMDFQPGPSHAPPPPHLAPSSPLRPDHPRFQYGESPVDNSDEDAMPDATGLGELGGLGVVGGGGGGPGQPMPLAHPASMPGGDQDEDDEDDDDDEDGQNQAPEGAYDPSDYEHLSVSPEISELFSYITRYTPQAIELEYRLRPYIPDYIPAVGDIDAFIKIPPPDGKPTLVGLEVLDEPSARQSDATVLDLQLRALAKHTTAKSMSVKTVENAEKNGKVIEKWVRDISELHRSKPAPTVHYSKRMPDIDSLMQEWPGEVEELLKEVNLPTAALEMELTDYVDIICGVLDIPAYKSRVQSLHVLFTLYSVFKNSAHFRQLAEENYIDNDDSTADHLVIQ